MSVVAYTSATLNVDDVLKGFDLMTKGDVFGRTFRDLKTPLRLDQATHAAQHAGSSSGWPGKSPATLARHGRKPSKLLGRLPTAVSYTANADGVAATSRVKWSGGAMTEGGRVGHGAVLPAREFLWISDEMLQLAEDAMADRIVGAYGGQP